MKVIRAGNQEWVRECECINCFALLRIDKSDLYQKSVPHAMGQILINVNEIYFKCTECSEETFIQYDGPNKKDIPFSVSETFKPIQTLFKFFNDLIK